MEASIDAQRSIWLKQSTLKKLNLVLFADLKTANSLIESSVLKSFA